jgi:hypothetical protein
LGSPDFSNHLNMAGFFDTQQQQASSQCVLRQLSSGLLLPELVLQSQPATNHATHCFASSADQLYLLGQRNKDFDWCDKKEQPEGHHHHLNALGPLPLPNTPTASQQVLQPPAQLNLLNHPQTKKEPEQQQQQLAPPALICPASADGASGEHLHPGRTHPAATAAATAAAAAPHLLSSLTAPCLLLKPLQTRRQAWQLGRLEGLQPGRNPQQQEQQQQQHDVQCDIGSHLHQSPPPPPPPPQQQQEQEQHMLPHVAAEAATVAGNSPGAKRLKSAATRGHRGKAAQAAASSSAAFEGADRLVWAKMPR